VVSVNWVILGNQPNIHGGFYRILFDIETVKKAAEEDEHRVMSHFVSRTHSPTYTVRTNTPPNVYLLHNQSAL
jgi:hypothetical protein